jgi:hypothetical protein
MNVVKTIKMPKELLAKWLAALRSGKYRQGHNAMVDMHGGRCCLAVLVAETGDAPKTASSDNSLPYPKWLKEKGIEFVSNRGILPSECRDPFLPTLGCSASAANDQKGKSFTEIADAVEACAEGV